jgi:hypothetical protein
MSWRFSLFDSKFANSGKYQTTTTIYHQEGPEATTLVLEEDENLLEKERRD